MQVTTQADNLREMYTNVWDSEVKMGCNMQRAAMRRIERRSREEDGGQMNIIF